MNKKPTILAVAALGSLALIGTGFAGWVITQEASAAQSGNIQAMAVTDGRVDMAISAFSPTTIKFGKPAFTEQSSSIAGSWFNFESADEEDVLSTSATITIKYNTATVTNRFPALTFAGFGVYTEDNSVKTSIGETGAWSTARTKNVVAKPTYELSAFARDETEKNKLTCTLTVTFAYGSHFGDQNPYFFYNGQSYSSSIAQDALDYGKYLGDINGAKFVLNFKAIDSDSATADSSATANPVAMDATDATVAALDAD